MEGYDHGATVCGVMGSKTLALPPGVEPTKPAFYATGFGIIDSDERLVGQSSGIVCLDTILGPYQLTKSDYPDGPPPGAPEDGPVGLGQFVFVYQPASDTFVDESSGATFHRMKYATVAAFREALTKPK